MVAAWTDGLALVQVDDVVLVANVEVDKEVVDVEVETGKLGAAEAAAVVSPPRWAAPVAAVKPPAAYGSNSSMSLGCFLSECLTAILSASSSSWLECWTGT